MKSDPANICKELIEKIRKNKIKTQEELEKDKTKISGRYITDGVVKNADIIDFLNKFCKKCRKHQAHKEKGKK